jgi:zinc protease
MKSSEAKRALTRAGAKSLVAFAVFVAIVPAAVRGQPAPSNDEFRNSRPTPLAEVPGSLAPLPIQQDLKNGVRLLVVENHALPLVAVEALIGVGTDGEPLEKAGLAAFTAAAMLEATKTRTAALLAQGTATIGARFTASADPETTSIRLQCPSETLGPALDLLADVLVNPAFDPGDVERVRWQSLAERGKHLRKLWFLDLLDLLTWGPDHPWGQPSGGTVATINAVAPADLASFHEAWYRPRNTVISISGDVAADQPGRFLSERLATWEPRPVRVVRLPRAPILRGGDLRFVSLPAAQQSYLEAVGRGPGARDVDALPLAIATAFLKAASGSSPDRRLAVAVRALRSDSLITLATEIPVQENVADAVVKLRKALTTFTARLGQRELQAARDTLARDVSSQLETNAGMAHAMAMLAFQGLPLDHFRTLPDRVKSTDAAAIARVTKKYLAPQRMTFVVAASPSREGDLKSRGLHPVNVRSGEISRTLRK